MRKQDEEGIFFNEEYRIKAKDGSFRWIRARSFPMADANGQVYFIAGIGEDITEHKKAAKELFDVKMLLEKTFASLDEAVFVIDPVTHTIISCNEAVEKIFGYKEKEVIGRNAEFLHVDREMYERFSHELFSALDEEGIFQFESRMRRMDGSIFFCDHTVTEIVDDSGNRTGYVSAIKDITEKKKIEDIQLERERLISTNKAKTEFLDIMGHELRTPLTSIIGYSTLLKTEKSGKLNRKQEQYIDNVLLSSEHLLDLIEGILGLVKLEGGKIEIDAEEISVHSAIDETINLMKENAAKRNIIIQKEYDTAVDVITTDKQKFKQVLFNLLSNAIKSSKEEGGFITISTTKEADMVKISVSDTGIGIKENEIKRIFLKLEQLEKGTSRKYGGTGLGLTITKQLVELQGGTIDVESKYGIGSTFSFLLPIEGRDYGS